MEPELIIGIIRVFKDLHAKVRNMVIDYRSEEDVGTGFIVTELQRSVSVDLVRKELESLKHVSEVKIVEFRRPRTGSIPRYIMLSDKTMEAIIALREKFGSGGQAFLYHQGMVVGEALAREYMSLGIEELREGIDFFLLQSAALGGIKGEVLYYTSQPPSKKSVVMIVRLHHNWECMISKKQGVRGPASHFERGVIAGLVQAYTNSKVTVEEYKCVAKEDPYCEFMVATTSTGSPTSSG